eukprot:Skav213613  [mRNA]  locus=scaffold2986:108277:124320:- [translate_table: standard]
MPGPGRRLEQHLVINVLSHGLATGISLVRLYDVTLQRHHLGLVDLLVVRKAILVHDEKLHGTELCGRRHFEDPLIVEAGPFPSIAVRVGMEGLGLNRLTCSLNLQMRLDVDVVSFAPVLEDTNAFNIFDLNANFKLHLVRVFEFHLRQMCFFVNHVNPHAQRSHMPFREQGVRIIELHSLDGLHGGGDQVPPLQGLLGFTWHRIAGSGFLGQLLGSPSRKR